VRVGWLLLASRVRTSDEGFKALIFDRKEIANSYNKRSCSECKSIRASSSVRGGSRREYELCLSADDVGENRSPSITGLGPTKTMNCGKSYASFQSSHPTAVVLKIYLNAVIFLRCTLDLIQSSIPEKKFHLRFRIPRPLSKEQSTRIICLLHCLPSINSITPLLNGRKIRQGELRSLLLPPIHQRCPTNIRNTIPMLRDPSIRPRPR